MPRLRKYKFLKIIVLAIIFTIVILVWTFLIGFSSNQPGRFFNKGHNAIWIGHEWVGENKTDQEIQSLINDLKKYQIDTVFVHVGPLNKEGTIDPKTYKYALNFIDRAKKIDNSIKYQAWLGQLRNKIDLSNPEIRHNIANLSLILADLAGFDGIHFDIEPVWDNDLDFIKLLEEVRNNISEDKVISVALPEFIPQSILWLTENIYSFENFNSEVNYTNVSKYADQIVAMIYDTGIDSEWFYRWFVNEQTIRITNLVEDKEVFIAIPSYADQKEGFNPKVENIENGLLGIIKGLNNFRSNEESFVGVAIYSYWEMDEKEWLTYEDLWLK